MSFKIEAGLFQLDDFTDHHAILGVTIDANPEQIRQRYKHVARLLHPDSSKAQSQAEKERGTQLFSKLVSPAYAQLSKASNRTEHDAKLRRWGKHLAAEEAKIQINSEAAKQLAQTGNLDKMYYSCVEKLAASQYESLDKALDKIALLSELNMVYLMRKHKENQGIKPLATTVASSLAQNGAKSPSVSENKPVEQPVSPVEPYIHRAQDYLAKNNTAKAILELRDALELEPNNSSCHSLLGISYLKQHQATMARIHITQALKLNPKDPIGLEGKQILDKLAQKASSSKTTTPPGATQTRQTAGKPPEKPGGGLFGGMFGTKKK